MSSVGTYVSPALQRRSTSLATTNVTPAKHDMYRLRNHMSVSPAKHVYRIRNTIHISQVEHSQKVVSQAKQCHVSQAIPYTVHESCFTGVTQYVTPVKHVGFLCIVCETIFCFTCDTYVSSAIHMYRIRNSVHNVLPR